MRKSVTFKYSPQIVATATRRYFCRYIGVGGTIGFIVLWLGCFGLLASGDLDWLETQVFSRDLRPLSLGISYRSVTHRPQLGICRGRPTRLSPRDKLPGAGSENG